MTLHATTSGVARLVALGQSAWYDNLTRPLARGGLDELIERHRISGVTSNPTIFEKAITAGRDYAEQLGALGRSDPEVAYWDLVVDDIGQAADRLRPVFDATGGDDGYVSVEVSPLLAHDTAGTVAQAQELFARIAKPNVMIKIPATPAGLPAVSEVIAAGVNVNVTLIFSLDRYRAVIDAYLDGLARLADPSAVASVASFFVSRVDTETDARLAGGHPLRGRVAVANAKLAYELFEARFSAEPMSGEPFSGLAAAGARPQRPLWASTSTKNPDYSPTLYVDELVGPNSVNTLAPASIDALSDDDGLRADSVRDDLAGARAVIDGLAEAGVDYDDVTATLERDGVEAFAQSYRACLDALSAALR
jgi:transaldolase